MPVYIVTGKLGAGKTLMSVSRIRDAFERGVPVATNIDIKPWLMLGYFKRKTKLYRVPDKPTVHDLEILGDANPGDYNERKNGLLVLDELGTWFNSRSWNDKQRQPVIDWFIHARKYSWDILLLVQDISIIDKQLRESLAEHVVYCRRTDRLAIPLLTSFTSLMGFAIRPPKGHFGIVKYGSSRDSLKADTWYSFGTSLYKMFNTKQAFISSYRHGTYSVLPSYYSHGRYMVKRNVSYYMRLSKIYFKQFNRLLCFGSGAFLCCLITLSIYYQQMQPVTEIVEAVVVKPVVTDPSYLTAFELSSYVSYPNKLPYFVLSDGDTSINSQELLSDGFKISGDNNHVQISGTSTSITIRR